MANPNHVAVLEQGAKTWNAWRERNHRVVPDLTDAALASAKLGNTNLNGAKLGWANLYRADLRHADLRGADLNGANLNMARLAGAILSGANLEGVDLYRADLRKADLRNAVLRGASLVDTNLEGANLSGAYVYGISVWNVQLSAAIESDLVITRSDQSPIQVDHLEVAQFIYLLLNNEKIRTVIDTVTSKVVLILGRFTRDRKVVLNKIRDELRTRDYVPVLFDFLKPASRNLTQTVSTLAHLARFVIADITDAKSIPQELERIVPHLPSVPIQPLLLASHRKYGMFSDFEDYPWVLKPFIYQSQSALVAALDKKVIAPAEARLKKIDRRKGISSFTA